MLRAQRSTGAADQDPIAAGLARGELIESGIIRIGEGSL